MADAMPSSYVRPGPMSVEGYIALVALVFGIIGPVGSVGVSLLVFRAVANVRLGHVEGRVSKLARDSDDMRKGVAEELIRLRESISSLRVELARHIPEVGKP